jgi:hypothetical protein
MRFRGMRVALAAALLLSAAAPSRASVPEGFLERVNELVRWIAARTDYPPELNRIPRFVFLSPEAIRHDFSRASLGYSDETSSVRAAQTAGTIYLPNNFTVGRDDFILLHELVHHLQDESGKRFECLATREREAYALQSQFVLETGRGDMPNDMFMLLLRCDVR